MLEADTEGFTSLLPGQQQNALYAEFYLKPVQDEKKTLDEGRPIFNEAEYVKIMVPGDKSTIIDRPVRLGHMPKCDNQQFPQQYAAFKAGLEQVLDGTLLSEWAMISRSQVKELEFFNVKTVEQLAEMSDTNTQNFAGILGLRDQARAYISKAKEEAPTAQLQAALTEKDEQLAAMQQQMDAMQSEMKAMNEPKRRGKAQR